MAGPTGRFAVLSSTRSGWWTFGLGVSGVLAGPLLGFGLVGVVLATAALVAGVAAYRDGDRSWMLWVGAALAVGTLVYLPFRPSDYPYTNGSQ